MHEYPITLEIIGIAEEYARKNGAQSITKINLVVGDLSGFIGDSIQMYFDIIAAGTLAEGAVLEIERVRPRLRCSGCGNLFERRRFSFACPKCGQDGLPTEIGREFYLKSIEIET